MNEIKSVAYFAIFFVIFASVKDMSTEEKVKEFMKNNSYTHTFGEYIAKYSNIFGAVVAGCVTTSISFIPKFYKAPRILFMCFILASILVVTKKLFNFPSFGWQTTQVATQVVTHTPTTATFATPTATVPTSTQPTTQSYPTSPTTTALPR